VSILFLFGALNLEARDFISKTFFKSQPLNNSFGCGFFDSAPEKNVASSWFFQDIKCNVSAIYRCSRDEEKLGEFFGIKNGSNEVSIGAHASEYDLFNQKIIYYDEASGYSAPLVRGIFKLRPREIIRGLSVSLRKWLGAFYCDLAITGAHTEHSWQLKIDDAVVDPVTGIHAISYLQGGIKTSNQNKLLYATIKDVIPSNGYEVLGVVLTAGSDCALEKGGVVGGFGELIFPGASYKYHDELFSPVLGNVGHIGLGLGFRGLAPFAQNNYFTMGFFSLVKALLFFESKEKRLTGVKFKSPVGFASENWGHYVLAKKTTEDVYDPAINLVGPQTVVVRPGQEGIFQLGAFFEGSRGALSVSYRSWLRGDEDLILYDQPATALLYDRVQAAGTYQIAPDLENCRVPAVATHTIGLEASVYVAQGMGVVHCGAAYEFVRGNAALSNISVSGGLSMVF